MSIRGTLMCAAGAFLITAVLFAAAMVISQRVFVADSVESVVPNTGDDPLDAAASEGSTDQIALATDRAVITRQSDGVAAPETSATPPDEPAPEDAAPPPDAADDRERDGDRGDAKPASSQGDADEREPDTAPRSAKTPPDDGGSSVPKEKPTPPQPRQPTTTPPPSPPASSTSETQTSSYVVDPPETEQRDDSEASERNGWGWGLFKKRDNDGSWWDFFSWRDDRRDPRGSGP